jgi:hypothetical protein
VLQWYFRALVDNTAFAKKHQQAFLEPLPGISFIFIPSNDVKKCQQRRNILKNHVLSSASSIALTSDVWSRNAKEDYISVVAHYMSAGWVLQKKVIGLRLIEVRHTGENIAEKLLVWFRNLV